MATSLFKGFKQVTLAAYNGLSKDEKLQYMWLVRDLDGENVKSASIYFGTRKYAEINANVETELAKVSANLTSVVNSLGASFDEDGNFVGFLPIEGHSILGQDSVDSVSDALTALETAIVANQTEIAKKADASDLEALEATVSSLTNNTYTKEEIDNAFDSFVDDIQAEVKKKADATDVEALETVVSGLSADLVDANAEIAKKADASDVYTKAEVDGKVAGLWHFKGVKDSLEALENEAKAEGDVWQVGNKEYAWNGSEFVELGFNVDLSTYATKDEVKEVAADFASGITAMDNSISEVEDRVDALEDTMSGSTADLQSQITALETEVDNTHKITGNDVE